jgi:succinyl-diaminopimelate desuccinylase
MSRDSRATHDVVRMARQLIRTVTPNPPGNTTKAADVVEAGLAGALDLVRLEPVPGFVSVLASHTFPRPGRTLILCGHLDVVPVNDDADGWSRDPWGAEIVDGWIYGRGSLDMKGAVAAMMVAARRAVDDSDDLSGRIVLALVADEECGGQRGAGSVVRDAVQTGDGVIVGEPGDVGIAIAHRGMCFVELTTRGRATHASSPRYGVNAVTSMVRTLAALEGVQFTHTPHTLLGGPSLAIGTMIRGGSTPNMIPDICRATVDVRKVPGMTDDSVLSDLRRHLATAGIVDPVTLRITASVEPSITSPTESIVEVAEDAYREEFRRDPKLRGMSATTGGWWFRNQLGIPTVMALGPGRIRDCHIVDERVSTAELESYARIYESVIRRFLGDRYRESGTSGRIGSTEPEVTAL